MESWTPPGWHTGALIVHDEGSDCHEFTCMIHNPTAQDPANREGWPYHWRGDRGIMERTCPHGIGHPDPDSARYLERIGRDYENIHGCDGCCSDRSTDMAEVEEPFTLIEVEEDEMKLIYRDGKFNRTLMFRRDELASLIRAVEEASWRS